MPGCVPQQRQQSPLLVPGQSWHLKATKNGRCFQSTNTSCETCRQEAGSSRKLTQEREALLGVAPERGFADLEIYFISDRSFYLNIFEVLWELKDCCSWLTGNTFIPPIPYLFACSVPSSTLSLELCCAQCLGTSQQLPSKSFQRELSWKQGIAEFLFMLL